MFHLRAGYCSALNPAATGLIERIYAGEAVTLGEIAAAAQYRAGPEPVTDNPAVTLSEPEISVTEPVSVTDRKVSVTPGEFSVACEGCGQFFKAKRATAKFCSTACRMKVHRDK